MEDLLTIGSWRECKSEKKLTYIGNIFHPHLVREKNEIVFSVYDFLQIYLPLSLPWEPHPIWNLDVYVEIPALRTMDAFYWSPSFECYQAQGSIPKKWCAFIFYLKRTWKSPCIVVQTPDQRVLEEVASWSFQYVYIETAIVVCWVKTSKTRFHNPPAAA